MDAKRKRLDLRGGTAMHEPADLPEHLIFEILSWLPAASLVRFKSVRKSWRDLIESPTFAATHNQNRSFYRSSDSMLLVSRFRSDPDRYEYRFSLVSFADDNKDTSNVVEHVDFPFYTGDEYLVVSGYCRGVICLSDGDFVALANPGIRQFRVLSGSCISFPSTEPKPVYDCYSGFGYDPISGDYKVVRVWKIYGDPPIPRVEIYTLSTDSWREINGEPFLVKCEWYMTPGKYFNGAFYWWVENTEEINHDDGEDEVQDSDSDVEFSPSQSIIVFDMSKEVFVLVRCPEPYLHILVDEDIGWNLLIMNESLVLLSYRGSLKSFEIQAVYGNGGDISRIGLAKLETIKPPHGDDDVLYPLVFWKNGEILFLFSNDDDDDDDVDVRIVSHKKGSDETKSLPIRLSHNSRQPREVRAEAYTSSLISIAGGQQLDGGN